MKIIAKLKSTEAIGATDKEFEIELPEGYELIKRVNFNMDLFPFDVRTEPNEEELKELMKLQDAVYVNGMIVIYNDFKDFFEKRSDGANITISTYTLNGEDVLYGYDHYEYTLFRDNDGKIFVEAKYTTY